MIAQTKNRQPGLIIALALLALVSAIAVVFRSSSAAPLSPGAHAAVREQPGLVPRVSRSIKNDVSPLLRDMKPLPFTGEIGDIVEMPPLPAQPRVKDPVVQTTFGLPGLPGLMIPTPIVSFEGIANQWGVYPPDTNGDVGPNHYVQTVNL